MADLVAQTYLLVGFRNYQPGELLPTEDTEQAEAWVAAGAAAWCEEPPATYKAAPASAMAGMPGQAIGGEVDGNDLVGRIPFNPARNGGPHR